MPMPPRPTSRIIRKSPSCLSAGAAESAMVTSWIVVGCVGSCILYKWRLRPIVFISNVFLKRSLKKKRVGRGEPHAPRLLDHRVVAGPAVEDVLAISADEDVVARPATESVVAGAADKDVIALAA